MALSPFTGGMMTDPFFGGFGRGGLGDMDRVFDSALNRFFGGRGAGATSGSTDVGFPGGMAGPLDIFRSVAGGHPMDVIETPNSFEVMADAPGFRPDEIKVEVNENVINISGEHQDTKEEKDKQGRVVRSERSARRFTRSFVLPDNAKPDDIQAQLDKGVLKVIVPKVPEAEKPQPKRITVSPGGGQATSAGGQATGAGGQTTKA